MGSRLTCCAGGSSQGSAQFEETVPASSTLNIPLFEKANATKAEIEYGMVVDGAVDKIEVGRITILWDQSQALKTSHEQEDSPNLGVLDNVVITPWQDATNVGITVTNNYGEPLTFKYYIVNTFNIVFTP
jgi:hypothetical protein